MERGCPRGSTALGPSGPLSHTRSLYQAELTLLLTALSTRIGCVAVLMSSPHRPAFADRSRADREVRVVLSCCCVSAAY